MNRRAWLKAIASVVAAGPQAAVYQRQVNRLAILDSHVSIVESDNMLEFVREQIIPLLRRGLESP